MYPSLRVGDLRRPSPALLFAVACLVMGASAGRAQGIVPPFRLGLINPIPGLGSAPIGVASVSNASFARLPGLSPGMFYASLTVTGLPPAMGGVGWSDLLCGYYDAAADIFTPNSDAAGLNTATHDQFMSVYHNGLLAVFDRYGSFPLLASRTSVSQPWQVVGPIGNVLPGQSTFNPSIVDYRGQTYLVFNFLSGIAMQSIDVVTSQLTGPLYQPIPIVNSSGGHAFAGSPITDPSGELLGMSYYELMGSSHTDHYVALDLDPLTPGMLLLQAPSNMHYSGCAFIGGRFFDLQFPNAHLFAVDTIWCTGGRAPVGGTMDVRIFTPPAPGAGTYASVLGGGSSYLPQGLLVPGIQGLLGLIPMGWVSSLVVHDDSNGEGIVTLTVPNSPTLSGISVPVQSLTWNVTSGAAFLGNTARVSVD